MNFVEAGFMLHLLIVLGVTCSKMYNIFNRGERINLQWSFLTFIVVLFGWFIGLTILIAEKSFLYGILFKFTSLFLILNVLFMIFELFFFLGVFANKQTAKRNSIKEYKMS